MHGSVIFVSAGGTDRASSFWFVKDTQEMLGVPWGRKLHKRHSPLQLRFSKRDKNGNNAHNTLGRKDNVAVFQCPLKVHRDPEPTNISL